MRAIVEDCFTPLPHAQHCARVCAARAGRMALAPRRRRDAAPRRARAARAPAPPRRGGARRVCALSRAPAGWRSPLAAEPSRRGAHRWQRHNLSATALAHALLRCGTHYASLSRARGCDAAPAQRCAAPPSPSRKRRPTGLRLLRGAALAGSPPAHPRTRARGLRHAAPRSGTHAHARAHRRRPQAGASPTPPLRPSPRRCAGVPAPLRFESAPSAAAPLAQQPERDHALVEAAAARVGPCRPSQPPALLAAAVLGA